VILVNSKPGDDHDRPGLADASTSKPLEWQTVARILERERPDAILPTVGGQTALNLRLRARPPRDLARARRRADRRQRRRDRARRRSRALRRRARRDRPRVRPRRLLPHRRRGPARRHVLGLPRDRPPLLHPRRHRRRRRPRSCRARRDRARGIESQPDRDPRRGVRARLEGVRDRGHARSRRQLRVVCSIENLDPMGVHTGDSDHRRPRAHPHRQGVSAPPRRLLRGRSPRSASHRRRQHPVRDQPRRRPPDRHRDEPPRLSQLRARLQGDRLPDRQGRRALAVGYTLDELANEITRVTPASFEPSIDYVVVKIPRFAFEKFREIRRHPRHADEVRRRGHGDRRHLPGVAPARRSAASRSAPTASTPAAPPSPPPASGYELASPAPSGSSSSPTPSAAAGLIDRVFKLTAIDPWFIDQIAELVEVEAELAAAGLDRPRRRRPLRRQARGFSRSPPRPAQLAPPSSPSAPIARPRPPPRLPRVDTCAAEFAPTPPTSTPPTKSRGRGRPSARRQGRSSSAAAPTGSVRASSSTTAASTPRFALREAGFETIMVNCNPETVSTDYDTSDRLYFEPLTLEHVLEIVHVERPDRRRHRPARRPDPAAPRARPRGRRLPILGTTPEAIDLAEDRGRFGPARRLGLRQPANWAVARTPAEAEAIAARIGYPVSSAPATCSAAAPWRSCYSPRRAAPLHRAAVLASPGDHPVLLDHYLRGAIEVDVDALSDGTATSSSPASWSTSRRPACTPATPPARSRPSTCPCRCKPRSAARPPPSPARSASSAS
jgi:carbamoyl-phosphate synthase large subunit